MRAYIYKIQGLRKQIFLTKKHQKDFEPISKMRNELAQELRNLKKLKEYKNATFSTKEKYINPKYARLMKPDEVFQLIQIGKLSRTHSLYSNHIHSEYVSIRQLNSALKKGKESEDSFSTVLSLCSRITALVISNLTSQYDLKRGEYSKAPKRLIKLIESLNELSARL